MNIIRKISVGSSPPDGCMHFQLGKTFEYNGLRYVVTLIKWDTSENIFHIYIKVTNDPNPTTLLWKSIVGHHVIIEYKTDFE